MKFRIWFLETRPQFLLLSVALVLLGTAMSGNEGHFNCVRFALTMIGLILAHASVNILNDYFDFKSGIDLETRRTHFSGGSGILPQGLMDPKSAFKFGAGCLLAAFLIGLYLTAVSGWQLLPLILLGGLVIYFYTSYLTKWLLGEFWAGLGLGTLPVLGTYFVQTGSYTTGAFVASLAPGFLTANLLLLNEFPDAEADKKGGRFHLVIALGTRKDCCRSGRETDAGFESDCPSLGAYCSEGNQRNIQALRQAFGTDSSAKSKCHDGPDDRHIAGFGLFHGQFVFCGAVRLTRKTLLRPQRGMDKWITAK
jgi:1,4-dihydroxy-2-naphthoate octaprenyltransferase